MPLYKIPKRLCFCLLLLLLVVGSVVFFYCCFVVVGYCNYHSRYISYFILMYRYGYSYFGHNNWVWKWAEKLLFFSHGPISREKANLHRKCKNRKSENIRHSQNRLLSAVCSSKCKKMLWGGDLLFPAPKMFFCPFFKDPSFEGLKPL